MYFGGAGGEDEALQGLRRVALLLMNWVNIEALVVPRWPRSVK